jgi:hypothetical protein
MEYEDLTKEEYVRCVETVYIPEHEKRKRARKWTTLSQLISGIMLPASLVVQVYRGDEVWALFTLTIGSLLALCSYMEKYHWNRLCILMDIMIRDKDKAKALLEKNSGT